MPPASEIAARSASHHASGSTLVPSGCEARPVRTTAPVAASAITTLQDCVEESTPITSAMAGILSLLLLRSRRRDPVPERVGVSSERVLRGSASAHQVLGCQLLQAHEAEALAAQVGVGVEVLVGAAVREEVVVALALVEGRLRQLGDLGGLQGLLHLGVGAERGRALLEQQVHPHVRGRRVPDALLVLGAAGLVVEVTGAVVGGRAAGAAVLEQVHQSEGVVQVAVTEAEIGRAAW